jgi:nucleoside-diphosphate-sugar epimerase
MIKNVLVTGNHGYIGTIMTHELIKEGFEVTGVDCDYFDYEKPFGRRDAFESKNKVKTQIKKDIRDLTKKDFEGIDAVIHLAALPNDWACNLSPNATQDINYLSTLQLATNAKRAGVERFVYASSCSVYGVKGNEEINEGDRPAPITPYGFSKLNSEEALKNFSTNDFSVVSMRNATCYGVSPRMRFDMVLNNLVGWVHTTGVVNMHESNGKTWRPIVHIEDVAQAYILALKAPKNLISSNVFSVVGENYMVTDIAEIAKESVPGSTVIYAENAPQDWRSYRVIGSKIEKMLGFSPKWNAKEGAKELRQAYESYGLTEEEFKQNRIFWAGKQFSYLINNNLVDKDLKLKSLD